MLVVVESEGPLWSGIAYDAWFDEPWGRYAFAVEAAAVMAALGPLSGREVLDVGCGTGRLAAVLSARGARVVGVDPEPSMLAVAAARTPRRLVRGDATCLPVRSASMDAVVAVAVLEFMVDPRQAMRELWRVTRPGGRVVVGSLNPRSPWGFLHRRELRRAPWSAARFLTRRGLFDLARPYGPARLTSVLFAPGALPALAQLGPALEALGRVAPRLGAFRVLSIERS
jgi:SAM-dependent methyltransferase